MMSAKKQLGVIYLDRQRLDFYGSNITTNVIHLDFPQNTIRDLEVINSDELNILIKTFIEFYKITPANIVLVLSENIYFEKDIQIPPPENLPLPEIQKFLDTIPFENISSKLFQLELGTRIIALNRQLYESVKNAFEKQGFRVKTVIPEFTLKKCALLKDSMDLETYKLILAKSDSLEQDSMLINQDVSTTEKIKQDQSILEIKKHLTLIVLSSIFLLLLGVLAFISIKTSVSKSTTLKQAMVTPKTYIITNTPTPRSIKPTEVVSKEEEEKIKIQIVSSLGTVGQEELVKEQLIKIGFKNIEIQQSENVTTPKTLVVFSTNLSSAIREKVATQINKTFGDISIQEANEPKFDIIIIIGGKI